MSNVVFGCDVGWDYREEASHQGWSFGGEGLVSRGDLGADILNSGTPSDPTDDALSVYNDEALGLYLWGERQLDQDDSVGLLLSWNERGQAGSPLDSEMTAYYTHSLSESLRLRVGLSHLDTEWAEDEARLTIQLIGFLGHHPHEGD